MGSVDLFKLKLHFVQRLVSLWLFPRDRLSVGSGRNEVTKGVHTRR